MGMMNDSCIYLYKQKERAYQEYYSRQRIIMILRYRLMLNNVMFYLHVF